MCSVEKDKNLYLIFANFLLESLLKRTRVLLVVSEKFTAFTKSEAIRKTLK